MPPLLGLPAELASANYPTPNPSHKGEGNLVYSAATSRSAMAL